MKIYQVDAFTTKVFAGNPAAVVPLEHWLDDYILQAIAAENNLAETAFTVPCGESWSYVGLPLQPKLHYVGTQLWRRLMCCSNIKDVKKAPWNS